MRIILTSMYPQLTKAWRTHCGEFDEVTIHEGSILGVACDAVVSPANSFGFMDGGLDLTYSRHFGWHVQQRLQDLIQTHHHGELLVGQADIVATNAPIPYVIAAPTMRVPMILRDTVNPYLAARAVLLLARHGTFRAGPLVGQAISDHVQTIAFPGLGTGVGKVPEELCAHQVRAAIESVLHAPAAFPSTWADAQTRHQRLYTDEVRDLQRWKI